MIRNIRSIHWLYPGMTRRRFCLNLLHSIWLVAGCLLWLGYINYMDGFGFMSDFMGKKSLLQEHLSARTESRLLTDKFLLLNTSMNNALLPLDNDNTLNTIITDRKMLAEKLEILDRNSDRIAFIICDIYFEQSSDHPETDSVLQAVILRLSAKKKFVMPGYFDRTTGTFQPPVFKGTTALSQYRSAFQGSRFLKYTYITHGKKQMSLEAFEAISGQKMQKSVFAGVPYYMSGNRPALNTIIPEFRFGKPDLIEGETYYQLGMFEDFLLRENQVVIIGDFEGNSDLHSTIAGAVPGPMVLLNAYLSLVHGDHLISVWYLLLLLAVFFWVSYQQFYNRVDLPEGKTLWQKMRNYLIEKRIYLVMLALVYVSMLFFHHYIHLLILLSYFALIGYIRKYVVKPIRGKHFKKIAEQNRNIGTVSESSIQE
jgi:hypothetical protein